MLKTEDAGPWLVSGSWQVAGSGQAAGSWQLETGDQAAGSSWQWSLAVALVVRALECHQLDFACFVYNVKTQR